MIDDEFFGSVEFITTTGLVPWGDPGEFVLPARGIASTFDEEWAGEISLKLILATEVVNQGECLFEVCDADSGTLEAMYAGIFDREGETREELDIEPGWNNIIFIEAMEIVPEFWHTTLAVQLVETAVATFASEGLIVTGEAALDLSKEQWRKLGFKRTAGTGFVFRDNLRVNPYGKGDRGT